MIKGLTDGRPSFVRLGVLRKGAPKPTNGNRPGADLGNHFRFDTDDEAAARTFLLAYGAEPNHINVYLPFQTAAENFDAWREDWGSGSLRHRCDGETCTRWQKPDGSFSDQPKPCPGSCKPVGRLMVIVPELKRFAYVTVQTTSIHDIMTLQANLDAAEMLRGDLRGIPFVLSRQPREISTPRADGKRVRVEKWLLSIEPAPAWVGHQLAAMHQAALPNVKALPDGQHVNTITGEVIDAPDFESEEEGDAPAQQTAAKVVSAANRPKAIARIRAFWRDERDLGGDLAAQNAEADLDLEALPGEQLEILGKRVRARVDALREALEEHEATDAHLAV